MKIPKLSYLVNRFDVFLRPISERENINLVRLYVDCFISFFLYGSTVKEYSLYRFYQLNGKERKEFLTGNQMDRFYKKNNDPYVAQTLQNKEKCLVHFSDFVHRDWCGYLTHNTEEEYRAFVSAYSAGIAKPLLGKGGHGIEIVKMSDFAGGTELRTYCQKRKVIVESLICQHEDMSRIHPPSINTIRMITVNGVLIGCVLRAGVGNSATDNASSGGIFALVDCERGIVVTEATNFWNKQYSKHPDTGVEFIGFPIPLWDECKALVRKAAPLTNGVPIVGWDIAITPQEPTLVEVNEAPGLFILQLPNRTGTRVAVEKNSVKISVCL